MEFTQGMRVQHRTTGPRIPGWHRSGRVLEVARRFRQDMVCVLWDGEALSRWITPRLIEPEGS